MARDDSLRWAEIIQAPTEEEEEEEEEEEFGGNAEALQWIGKKLTAAICRG